MSTLVPDPDWMTDSCLRDLTDVILAFEDASSNRIYKSDKSDADVSDEEAVDVSLQIYWS